MAKKPQSEYDCPKCGRACAVPVQYSNGDFLAVHRFGYGTTALSGIPCERKIDWCDCKGPHALAGCKPTEHLDCDLTQSNFEGHEKPLDKKLDRLARELK